MRAIAPNITTRSYLLRPTGLFTDDPLCSLAELKTTLTLDDLADMHEALDLREAQIDHAKRRAEQERAQRKIRRVR